MPCTVAVSRVPLINVENRVRIGFDGVESSVAGGGVGRFDVAIAVGAEKLYIDDNERVFADLLSGVDQDRLEETFGDLRPSGASSLFMVIYAHQLAWYTERMEAHRHDSRTRLASRC